MKRVTALLCVFLTLVWAQSALAAISNPVSLGSAQSAGSSVSSIVITTTADAPAGAPIIGLANLASGASSPAAADSASNSYALPGKYSDGTAGAEWMFHADNPSDLPAPCTVTATETSTTLVVSAVGTCASGQTFLGPAGSPQTITGGSFTGVFSGNCTLTAGAATCTITGGATVASPATATISSTITISWTTAGKAGVGAVSVSGLVTTSTTDLNGSATGNSSTGTSSFITSGTLAQAAELIIARTDTVAITSAFNCNGGGGGTGTFSGLSTITQGGGNSITYWCYQIVAATTAVTFNPSWTTSHVYGTNIYSFKGTSGAAPSAPQFPGMLLGLP